jgi:hypothetical protein
MLEALSPLLGRLGKLVVPDEPAGINGQLDQPYQDLLNWISSLPENQQRAVMAMNVMVSQSNPENLEKLVQQINNLLSNGTTATNSREYLDRTMYGN